MVLSSNLDLQQYHETFAHYANDQSNSFEDRRNFDVAATCMRPNSVEQRLNFSKDRRAITKRNEVLSIDPCQSGINRFRRRPDIWESKPDSNGLRAGPLVTPPSLMSPSGLLFSPGLSSPSAVALFRPWLASDLSYPSQSSPSEPLSSSSLPSPLTGLSSLLSSGLPAPSLAFLDSLLSSGLPAPLFSPQYPTSQNMDLGLLISSSLSSDKTVADQKESSIPLVSDYQQTCLRAADCLWPRADLVRIKIRPPPRNGDVRVPFMTEDYPWGRFEQLEEIKHLIEVGSNGMVNGGKVGLSNLSVEKCGFCRLRRETSEFAETHQLRNPITGDVTCPVLASHVCHFCGATREKAHTPSYCPRNPERIHMATLEDTRRNSTALERTV